jgi:hypothetical protein
MWLSGWSCPRPQGFHDMYNLYVLCVVLVLRVYTVQVRIRISACFNLDVAASVLLTSGHIKLNWPHLNTAPECHAETRVNTDSVVFTPL